MSVRLRAPIGDDGAERGEAALGRFGQRKRRCVIAPFRLGAGWMQIAFLGPRRADHVV